jgi:hypothetical protein
MTVMNRLYSHCQRCGKPLKSEESKKLGFGPNCFQKIQSNKLRRNVFIKD